MGTAVAVVEMNRPVGPVIKPNKALAKARLNRLSGPKNSFAGTQIRPNGKDGFLKIGYGAGAKEVEATKMVVLYTQVLSVWQYWPEGEAPSYPYISPVFGETSLPDRSQCGPKETKYNKLKREDEDVWKEGMMLIMRSAKTGELYHLECFGNVLKQVSSFLATCCDTEEGDKGLVPLVEIYFEKTKLKDGTSFAAIQFDILSWQKPSAEDLPMLASADASEADDADEDEPVQEVKAPAKKVERKVVFKHEPEPEAVEEAEVVETKPVAKSKRQARTEVDDDKPVVHSRSAPTSRASENNPRQPEDDDVPVARHAPTKSTTLRDRSASRRSRDEI